MDGKTIENSAPDREVIEMIEDFGTKKYLDVKWLLT